MDQQQVDEAAQLEAAHQAQGVAAQAAPEGPLANEQAALQWITTALAHARFVSQSAPSREQSIVVTRLEEAEMWAHKDLGIKSAEEIPDVPIEGETDAPAPEQAVPAAPAEQPAPPAPEAPPAEQQPPVPPEDQEAAAAGEPGAPVQPGPQGGSPPA